MMEGAYELYDMSATSSFQLIPGTDIHAHKHHLIIPVSVYPYCFSVGFSTPDTIF